MSYSVTITPVTISGYGSGQNVIITTVNDSKCNHVQCEAVSVEAERCC